MPDCLIIIPTRKRHERLGLLLDQIEATRQARTVVRVVLDADDPCEIRRRGPWLEVVTCRRDWLTGKINRQAVRAASEFGAVGWLADDCWPETPGWDALLLDALERSPGVAWPDSNRRPGFPEHQVISSGIIRALGWYFEPSLRHYCTDNVWEDLATITGCGHYVKDALVRHDHYEVTGGPRDQTYSDAEVNGRTDRELYIRWRSRRMASDAKTVEEAIAKSTKAR